MVNTTLIEIDRFQKSCQSERLIDHCVYKNLEKINNELIIDMKKKINSIHTEVNGPLKMEMTNCFNTAIKIFTDELKKIPNNFDKCTNSFTKVMH